MNINIKAFPVCDCAHDGDGMCAEDEVCKHCYCLPKGIKISFINSIELINFV